MAAELFQDVWASLVRVRATYEPRAKFSTWLYRMAHNRLIDHLRLLPRAPLPLEEDLIPAAAEHERPEAQALAGRKRRTPAARAGGVAGGAGARLFCCTRKRV